MGTDTTAMTPTNQDKLYTLAVAAAKSLKAGNIDKAIKDVNLMAHFVTEEDVKKAGDIANHLAKTEPIIPNVASHVSAYKMDIDNPHEEPAHLIDVDAYTHEEALFMLAVLIGGNLRGITDGRNQEERNEAAKNVNELMNMIMRTVTEEDWNKARAMSQRDKPEDPFKSFSA